MPTVAARPKGFEQVDDVTMALASNWVDGMFKEISLGERDDDVFDQLARRWRWNLYLIEPRAIKQSDMHGTIETIAKSQYEKFVGMPFKAKAPPRSPRLDVPADIPPAWQLEEIQRQSLLVEA